MKPRKRPRTRSEDIAFDERQRRRIARLEPPEKRAEYEAILAMTPQERTAYYFKRFSAELG